MNRSQWEILRLPRCICSLGQRWVRTSDDYLIGVNNDFSDQCPKEALSDFLWSRPEAVLETDGCDLCVHL